ncbi:MAG TPA: tetratricopeptide repeat protein, partial [Rhodospirillales bacterium]|nr:tetratricopeptide repeat protein [Rhodospirillales bacterium]
QNILAMVLGGAAAVATGRADVGTAVWLGGTSMSQRGLLQYSRTQEGAADQAALKFLDATKQSARGFLEFTETLLDQELLSVRRQDPYLRTHPLTQNRINAIRAHVSKSRYSNAKISPRFDEMHRRMLAKLRGFIESFTTTLRRYKETDNSLESRYARAVAYYRLPDLDKALPLINGLIAERPDDPYFHELKGQMLFENGRVKEALEPYEKAVLLLPNSALLRIGLARTQLESGDPALLDSAIVNLRAAVLKKQDSPFTWRQLAIAYGRKGDMGLSSLAMAEEALLNGKKSNAIFHANRAEKLLPRGSMGWMQAQDILQEVNQGKKRPDK